MTTALVMIVRDEEAVIERCLRSIRDQIDHWTICDTGSTDGTCELIIEALDGIPGQLLQHEWVNFGHNRTLAVQAALETADYLLVCDADDELHGAIPGALTADAYMIERRHAELAYRLPLLIRGDIDWRYRGAVHEYLESPDWTTTEDLNDCWLEHHHDGGAKQGRNNVYIEALEVAVAENPSDARAVFYLAQSHRDAGDWKAAIDYYRLRLTLGGWDEEIFYSRYQLGCLLCEHVGIGEGVPELLAAWNQRPSRIEPLRALANAANAVADRASATDDSLFVHRDQYSEAV